MMNFLASALKIRFFLRYSRAKVVNISLIIALNIDKLCSRVVCLLVVLRFKCV